MNYVVYGAPGSGSSLVEATLAEIGVPYEFRRLDMAEGEHRQPDYAAINPHCKAPTLITPEGETLTQSAAILLTLAERHPEANLLPVAGSRERAWALRWMMFAVSELYPIVEIIDYPKRFVAEEAASAGAKKRAQEIWSRRWIEVEHAIEANPYLLGREFCLADLYLAFLSRWDLSPVWRSSHVPQIERLAHTVAARPKLGEIWARNVPAQ